MTEQQQKEETRRQQVLAELRKKIENIDFEYINDSFSNAIEATNFDDMKSGLQDALDGVYSLENFITKLMDKCRAELKKITLIFS